MTSYKQLELEHAVLQGRVGELEEARVAAETRATDSAAAAAGCGQRANMSAVSSADMYAHLANSSDWSARQMGAIEGTLADEPNDILCAMKRCACKTSLWNARHSTDTVYNGHRQAACLSWEFQNWRNCFPSSGSRRLRLVLRHRPTRCPPWSRQ